MPPVLLQSHLLSGAALGAGAVTALHDALWCSTPRAGTHLSTLCLQARRDAEAREAAEDARVAAAIVEQERQAAAKEVAQREKRVKMQADMAAVRICLPAGRQRERRPGRPRLPPLVVHDMSCRRLHAPGCLASSAPAPQTWP